MICIVKATYNTDINTDIYETNNFVNNRFFKLSMIALGIIFTLIGAKFLGLYEKADALLVNTGIFSALFARKRF